MFITEAYAQAANGATSGSSYMTLVLMGGMFVVFYFLMIRPQMKRQKEHQKMISALAKGDEVVTAGGIMGRVTKVTDTQITVQIAEGVEIAMQRASVTQVLPKGTIK